MNKRILYVIGFGLLYLIWNYGAFMIPGVPHGLLPLGSPIDSSWIIGLNWASFLHSKWLVDNLVFTSGPLYYLDGIFLPEFHPIITRVLTNLGLNLFFAVCFAYIYSFFVNLNFEAKNRWIAIIVIAILLVQKPGIPLIPLFVAYIFLPVIFSFDYKRMVFIERVARYAISSLLLAVIIFVKFSHFYEALLFITIMIVFLAYKHKYLDSVMVGLLFAIFITLIWVLSTGENISLLFPYLISRFDISSGYTEAMMADFSSPLDAQIFVLALIFFAVLMLVLIYLIVTKRFSWATAWLLPMITLFLGFKEGFVRADMHVFFFLGYVFISALYYFYLVELIDLDEPSKLSVTWRQSLSQFFVPLLAIIVLSTFSFRGIQFIPSNAFRDIRNLINENTYTQGDDREFLIKQYPLDPAFLSQINYHKTIDIIPWDIALLYAYNLKWQPRPVIQSYASYTAKLDDLDAVFFQKLNSPNRLIYSLFAIDNRYAIFDTPHTFRTLLDNYQMITTTSDGKYALLNERVHRLSRNLILITGGNFYFNENISVPQRTDAYIFATVSIEPTLIGDLLDIIYKPTPIYVVLGLENGHKLQYRFIRETGKNGLFVSKYIGTLDDLRSVFNETYKQNIVSMRFIGNSWIYNNQFRISFYEIPFNN